MSENVLLKKPGVICRFCGSDMKPMADKKTWLCTSHNCMAIERNGQIIGIMRASSWKSAPSGTDQANKSE